MARIANLFLISMLSRSIAIAIEIPSSVTLRKSETFSSSYYFIANVTDLRSSMECISLCWRLNNCTAVQWRPASSVQCVLLSLIPENEYESSIYEDKLGILYEVNRCAPEYICHPNSCSSDQLCISTQSDSKNCWKTPYQCLCPPRKVGENCQSCQSGFAGQNCTVDIRKSRLIKGVYFYAPILEEPSITKAELHKNLTESRRDCSSRGMNLLTMQSKEKTEVVYQLGLQTTNYEMCMYYWIDLTREDHLSPYKWAGTTIDKFRNWYPGEPNENNKLAAAFSPYPFFNFTWGDGDPSVATCYVCEYELP